MKALHKGSWSLPLQVAIIISMWRHTYGAMNTISMLPIKFTTVCDLIFCTKFISKLFKYELNSHMNELKAIKW